MARRRTGALGLGKKYRAGSKIGVAMLVKSYKLGKASSRVLAKNATRKQPKHYPITPFARLIQGLVYLFFFYLMIKLISCH